MAEKRVIELEIQDNSKSLKAQYKEAVAELQNVSAQYGETSQQAIKAAKAAADLKDQIGFSKDLVDSFNPDAKFNALSKSVGGVLDGFQAVEGAMGLVGVESEALQETMLRVQSVMALSQGVQGLMEAKDSFKQLGTVALDALKGIRTGLAATGIGLFLVALGTIVAYWDDIKAAVSGVSEEQAKLNEETHKNFETSKEQLSTLDAQDNVLKLQGKSEREILNLKIAKVNTAIELGKIELENVLKTSKAEEAAAIQNYNMTKKIVDFTLDAALFLPKLMLMPIDMAIKGANKVSEALGLGKLVSFDLGKTLDDMQSQFSGFIAGSIFDVPALKKENEETAKEIRKSISDLENQKAGFQLSIKEMDKANAQKSIDAQKDEQDKKLQAEKEYNDKLREYHDALEQERQGQITDAKEKELQALDNKFEELYAKADAANQSDKELLIQHQQEIADINTKFALLEQEEALKKQEEAKKNAEELAKIEKEKLDKIAEAEKLAAEKAKQAQQQRVDLILKYAQTFGQAMGSLNNLLNVQDENRLKNVKKGSKEEEAIKRKMFERDKKLRIVQTIIDTASNVVQSIRNGGGIPTGIPFGVAAGAMGALQIAAISKTKFDGGGGEQVPSPAGAGGGGVMTPNFNVIGSSGVNQLAQIQQQPTRAYVVSGDVANGLSLERNRLQNATL
jgi:hypothetical protein